MALCVTIGQPLTSIWREYDSSTAFWMLPNVCVPSRRTVDSHIFVRTHIDTFVRVQHVGRPAHRPPMRMHVWGGVKVVGATPTSID
jgi:hypothetical protein